MNSKGGFMPAPTPEEFKTMSGGRCMESDTFADDSGADTIVRCELSYQHAGSWHRANTHEWRQDDPTYGYMARRRV